MKERQGDLTRLFFTLVFVGMLCFGNVVKAEKVITAVPETTTESELKDGGTIVQGWNEKRTSYYVKGKKVTGIKRIDGELYYFKPNGKLFRKKGLHKLNGKYYYFGKGYAMKTGVVKVKGKAYYFMQRTGARYEKSGFHKIGGKGYYFLKNASLKSGWYRSANNNRYYFDPKTYAATTGWKYVSGYKYYFMKNGRLSQDVRKLMKKNTSYKIKVNRMAGCVTVYAKDGTKGYTIPVVSFVCSPGYATPLGTFHTGAKYRWLELIGPCWGQWCTVITGDILFHSVYYDRYNDNRSLNVNAYNQLGNVVSHGCVRLTAADTKWIYDYCPSGTEVVIYDNQNNPGPFDKPKAQKLSADHTWDPTDPAFK